MENVIEKIKQSNLRKEQRMIADKIIGNIQKTAFLIGPELAKECGVSVSAITRFAQKLGYQGFPEFKKALEAFYRKNITPYEVFKAFDDQKISKKNVPSISVSQDIENIKNFESCLNPKHLDQTIELIKSANVIHLAAIAASEMLIELLGRYLEALGKKCNILKSFGISKIVEVTDFSEKDILIGVSFQRIIKEVVDVFQYVKRKNIKTIAITDSPLNPLGLEADVTLVTPVTGMTFGLSLAAPLVLINMIINTLAACDKKKTQKKLLKVKEDWEKYPIFCIPE